MKKIRPIRTSLLLSAFLAAAVPHGEAAFPQLKLELVCDYQLLSPLGLIHAGDGSGRSFVVEQRGKILIFKNGMLHPVPFLDIGGKLVPQTPNYDERGLLGAAFHPGYGNPASPGYRKFYVFYMETSPNAPGTTANPVNCRTVVAEYQVSAANPDVADPASERVLLKFDKPQSNHGGGGMAFGPDGYLYFTVGDGGSANDNNAGHTGGSATNPRPTNAKGNAQDLTKIFGKMHRIDPLGTNGPGGQYGIPVDNPFAASTGGELPEIYAWGLRNCWRFSFDTRPGGTGRLIAADVGQNAVEEIDIITKGGNYGWRNREGTFIPDFSVDAPAMTGAPVDPIGQYAHIGVKIGSPALPQLGLSITGGYIYRGSAIPALQGKYVFGDWSQLPIQQNAPLTPTGQGVLLGMEETSPGVWSLQQLDILGGNPFPRYIQSFGEDEAGELYVLTKRVQPTSGLDGATGLPSGSIYRIAPVPATTALSLTATKDNTIYQEGNLSNGAGDYLFSGATLPASNNAAVRRALIGWTLSSIPAGATVATASVTLKMDKTVAGPYAFSLHKMSADWGEGTSNAAGQEGGGVASSSTDVTWLKPVFGQTAAWTTPGGDFAPLRSATTTVNSPTSVAGGLYTWSGPGLAADLNAWLAAPATNAGWILKADTEAIIRQGTGASGQTSITVDDTADLADGMPVSSEDGWIGPNAKIAAGGINTLTNEITLTTPNVAAVSGKIFFAAPSAKRFFSRHTTTAANRPKLNLTYVPAPAAPATHRGQWEKSGYLVGQFISDAWDTDGDTITDGMEYAWGYPPRTRNDPATGFSVAYTGTSPVVITFRRDTQATDLTYSAQVSTDLQNWTTLASSTAGAVPTGAGFVSETPVDTTFRNVIVHDDPPVGATKRIYRLHVARQQ